MYTDTTRKKSPFTPTPPTRSADIEHILPDGDCPKCNGWGEYKVTLHRTATFVECQLCDGTGETNTS